MRAYRKTTMHPFCIYLTAEEARELVEEGQGVDPSYTPLWAAATFKIMDLLNDPKRERA